jgi:hypothetical protein
MSQNWKIFDQLLAALDPAEIPDGDFPYRDMSPAQERGDDFMVSMDPEEFKKPCPVVLPPRTARLTA